MSAWEPDRIRSIRPGMVVHCSGCGRELVEGERCYSERTAAGRFACNRECVARTPETGSAKPQRVPRTDPNAARMGEEPDAGDGEEFPF